MNRPADPIRSRGASALLGALRGVRSGARANRGFLAALLVFGLVRTAVADYNPVPSGSMHPNILEGDVILVNRLAYDLKVPLTDLVLARLGDPQRGDIVTFHSPVDGTRLVKRIAGIPGDTIEMRDRRLFVNGRAVDEAVVGRAREALGAGREVDALRVRERLGAGEHVVQWLAVAGSRTDFGPVEVPAGQYLMLGDNRDNSADSRYFGLVPRERLIGRAHHVLASVAFLEDWRVRVERFGMSLYDGLQ